MIRPEEGNVLDVGCGYGAVGIACAVLNPLLNVFLVDVNQRAIWLARQNVERNRVANVEVLKGHLYEPVCDIRFDCILSNPPVSAGMKTVQAIVDEAPKHMTRDGLFQMVIRSKVAGKRLPSFLADVFGNVSVLARKSGYRVLISKKL
jgi:16S rRNA (guanine1207-N2)-methyltransferase